jgi:hypothetical protein
MTPPNFDWFDLIEYYAFRITLLISFLYTLYEVLKRKFGLGEQKENMIRWSPWKKKCYPRRTWQNSKIGWRR